MIYSGYENGHYFVRFTHNMRIVDIVGVFEYGYKIVSGYMLLLKRRKLSQKALGFETA